MERERPAAVPESTDEFVPAIQAVSTVERERPAVIPVSTVDRERGHPIQSAWRDLSRHADACSTCGAVRAELRRVPEEPTTADSELHSRLCEDGRELHGAWIAAKAEWLESTRDGRRRLGVLGADQDRVLLRATAWERLPATEQRHVWELDDVARERTLEAIEAGILAEGRRTVVQERTGFREAAAMLESAGSGEHAAGPSEGAERGKRPAGTRVGTEREERPWFRHGRPRMCDGCGREHATGGRYCSSECRAKHHQLESTEVEQ